MRVLNFGSLNIDHVYAVEDFVRGGETKASLGYSKNVGGKGLNQSVALARAGCEVYHAGRIGSDGAFLVEYLENAGVNTDYIVRDGFESGHAIIQVNGQGENCILLNGGANLRIEYRSILETVSSFGRGDLLVLQNEINGIGDMIDIAYNAGMTVAMNIAPVTGHEAEYDLSKVGIINVNESEGAALTGENDEKRLIKALGDMFGGSLVLLTLGERGSVCVKCGSVYRCAAFAADVVDTTGAGDTFFGYFLREYFDGGGIERALSVASKAAALCVSRHGASCSIPSYGEVYPL